MMEAQNLCVNVTQVPLSNPVRYTKPRSECETTAQNTQAWQNNGKPTLSSWNTSFSCSETSPSSLAMSLFTCASSVWGFSAPESRVVTYTAMP